MILPVGEYEIPEDCTAQVHNRTVYVVKKLPLGRRIKLHETKYCRDCQHRVNGFTNRQRKTKVCKLRPKAIMNRRIYGERAKYGWEFRGERFYYAAPELGTICDKFKENEIEL